MAVRALSFVRPDPVALVLGLAAVAAAVPLWLVPHPPIQDLPQHLAAIRVIHDFRDPALGFAETFELAIGRTQYLAYYLAGHLLAFPFGVEVANRLLMTAIVVATPLTIAALASRLGGDRALGLLAIPLVWNAHLILGFLNFVAAIPLSFAAVAVAVRGRDRGDDGDVPPWGSWARFAGLAALLLLTFGTHVVPFAFAALGTALVAVSRRPTPTLGRLAVLAPAAGTVVLWALASPAGRSTVAAAAGGDGQGSGPGARFVPFQSALREWPGWMTDVFPGPTDDRLLLGWVVILGVSVVAGAVWRRGLGAAARPPSMRWRLALLPPLAVLLYFTTPASYDWIWPINARFPILAALWVLPCVPFPERPRALRGAVVGAAAALALASSLVVGRAFLAFEDEVGPLDAAVAAVPEGSRTAGLVFDRGSHHVKFSPFLHAVAWVQARRGGAVMFTFADFPHSPFRFRDADRPPRVRPRWEWMPERVDVVRDLDWYDHVLVRGPARPLERARQVWEPVFRDGPWSVWRRRPRPGS